MVVLLQLAAPPPQILGQRRRHLPTRLDLAGGDPSANRLPGAPPLAGRTLAPAFRKDGATRSYFLYFNHNNNRAIRAADWKLIATGRDGPWERHDLATDRSEMKDLAAAHPDRVREMSALWQKTRQRMRPGAANQKP